MIKNEDTMRQIWNTSDEATRIMIIKSVIPKSAIYLLLSNLAFEDSWDNQATDTIRKILASGFRRLGLK